MQFLNGKMPEWGPKWTKISNFLTTINFWTLCQIFNRSCRIKSEIAQEKNRYSVGFCEQISANALQKKASK